MAYVRNAWYVAAWTQDVETNKPSAMEILNERIVIWRTAAGNLHALEDRCVHRLAPLSLGRCEGERLRCMYHGFLFEPNGRVVEIPGQDIIPANAKVKTYPVVDKHSWIWVWMGDPAKADPKLIPPAVGFDDPNYILGSGFLDYAAEARLINDNLCDFSHLTYVHAESFGAGDAHAQFQPKLTALRRGIRVERWIPNIAGNLPGATPMPPHDRWSSYDYLLPGVLLMTGGIFPLGTAQACNDGPPDMSKAIGGVTFTSQAVTPMTDKTSRYFFSWGPRRDHGDEKHRDFLMGVAAKAFAEDKVMIEAQQRVVEATANPKILPSQHDRGVIMFNRLVERMAQEEAKKSAAAAA